MTLRDQIREAAVLLGITVVAAPPIYWLADWMRYGSEPNWFVFGIVIGSLIAAPAGALIVAVLVTSDDRRDLP